MANGWGLVAGASGVSKMSPERIQSERIKLLEQGIKLKKKLEKKGSNLSNKDLEEALQFSKKSQALNLAAAENVSVLLVTAK